MELCLRVGALLESGEFPIVVRVQVVSFGELLIRFHEGVEVSAHDDLVLGQIMLESQQIFPEIFHLFLILGLIGTEMHTDKDIVIGTCKGHAFCPSEIILLFLVDLVNNILVVMNFRERLSVEEDKRIQSGVSHHVETGLPQFFYQHIGILLDEKDISL